MGFRLFGRKEPEPPVNMKAEQESAARRHAALAELAAIQGAPADALTILLPSKGRAALLKAALRYYNSVRLPYKILVLLSGDEGVHQPEDYPNLDLTIVPFSDETRLPAKLIEGLRHIRTPLVALCTDDDIVLAEGLKKVGGFLAANPDYSAAQGYHAVFSHVDTTVNLTHVAWFCPSVESDDPLQRVHEVIRRYQPICWAVFRPDTFHKIIDHIRPEIALIFQEFLWALTAVIDGKVKRLPLMYCLRRDDRIYLTGHPQLAMLESPQQYFLEYATYREMFVSQLAPKLTRSKADFARMLDLSHLCYLSRELDSGVFNYFAAEVLANPKTSVLDEAMDRALRPNPHHAQEGWDKQVVQGNITYRLFNRFLYPEPRDEILLSEQHEVKLIKELKSYFAD